mgnify:CR=1 FL=1
MRLDDSVIGHVAKLIQLAILTGTDIVDHMRMMRLTEDDQTLFLDADYEENANKNIQAMVQQIEELTTSEE